MSPERRTVLAALGAAIALAVALIVADLAATLFFAVTVAYVLVPGYRWLRRRGVPRRAASGAATAGAFLAGVAVSLPIGVALYVRRRQLVALIELLPERLAVEVMGFVYVVDASDVIAGAARYVTRTAIGIARATPVLAAKAIVFAFVVYALLLRRGAIRTALLGVVPVEFHDVVTAFHERTRETLYALYVIQAATAIGTFLIALPIFVLLGYRYPVALAVVAGLLQFLPVVGPSVVVIGLAAFELAGGAVGRAALVLGIGLVFVALLPDAVLRPRLARRAADLPASLYFVGFTGGVLGLGPVGVIAGPLAVALLSEALSLLVDEMDGPPEPADPG